MIDAGDALSAAELRRVVWAAGSVISDVLREFERRNLLTDDRLEQVLREIEHWCTGDEDEKSLRNAMDHAFGSDKYQTSRIFMAASEGSLEDEFAINIRAFARMVWSQIDTRVQEGYLVWQYAIRRVLFHMTSLWMDLGEPENAAKARVQRQFRHAIETP